MNNRLPPLRRGGLGGNVQLPALADLLRAQNDMGMDDESTINC